MAQNPFRGKSEWGKPGAAIVLLVAFGVRNSDRDQGIQRFWGVRSLNTLLYVDSVK